jgi:hypothetical protein
MRKTSYLGQLLMLPYKKELGSFRHVPSCRFALPPPFQVRWHFHDISTLRDLLPKCQHSRDGEQHLEQAQLGTCNVSSAVAWLTTGSVFVWGNGRKRHYITSNDFVARLSFN